MKLNISHSGFMFSLSLSLSLSLSPSLSLCSVQRLSSQLVGVALYVRTISHESRYSATRPEGGLGWQTEAAAAWEMLGEISTVF